MKTKLPVLAIIIFAFSLQAQAQTKKETGASTLPKPRPVAESSEWKPHVGVMAGVAVPSGSGKSKAEMGLDVGYQYYIPFSLGAEYMHSEVDTGSETNDRDALMVKGSYNFGGDQEFIRNSYAALAVGAVFTPDGTAAALAPILGFDIPIKRSEDKYFSLGANTRYTFVSDNETDTYSLTGVVKYWY